MEKSNPDFGKKYWAHALLELKETFRDYFI